MTRDDVISLAREQGLPETKIEGVFVVNADDLGRLIAAERVAAKQPAMQDALMKFDPATGEERPYPSHATQWRNWHGTAAWLFDPWTGKRRNAYDVGSDVHGLLIVPAGTLGVDMGGGCATNHCEHPSGPHPQNEFCAWRTPKTEGGSVMELALVILATTSPFIALAWWANNEDKRRHERRMKELEIERLKQAAKDAAWKAMGRKQP